MQKSRKNAHLNFTIGRNEFCDYTGYLHGRRNTRNLRERLTQLTTNKVSIPYSRLLDRNFVFKNFAQLNTATAPERARCFAISAEYATFAVTY